MHNSLIVAVCSLFVVSPAVVPQSVHGQPSQVLDVNIKNLPDTQQVKGDVQVNNFPELQQVRGSVSLEGTTKFVKKEGIIVPASRRAEPSEMVYAGTIETEGFTSLLISMQGESRSDAFSTGAIGVLLIPDEKPILRTLRDTKRVQFPLECTVPTKSGDDLFFQSEQVQQRIAFSQYKMYLYNTANKSVEANVYLYLTNAGIK
jgi:hypothetical protein